MDFVLIGSVNKSIMLPSNMPTSVRRIEEQYSNLIRNHIMRRCIFFHHDQCPGPRRRYLRVSKKQRRSSTALDDSTTSKMPKQLSRLVRYSFLALERAADSMRRIAIGERRCALRECHQARIHRISQRLRVSPSVFDLVLISLQAVIGMAMMSTPKRSLPDPLLFSSPSLIRERPSSLLAPFRLVGSVRSLSVSMTDTSGVALEVFLVSQCCLSSCKIAFWDGIPHDHHVR